MIKEKLSLYCWTIHIKYANKYLLVSQLLIVHVILDLVILPSKKVVEDAEHY